MYLTISLAALQVRHLVQHVLLLQHPLAFSDSWE